MNTDLADVNSNLATDLTKVATLASGGEIEAALRLCSELRRSHPMHSEPWLTAATLLHASQRNDEAETLLAEAVSRFPADPCAGIEFAQAAERRRDWHAAVRRWDDVRAQFPDQSAAYVHGATMRRHLGDFDAAQTMLQDACARFPNDPESFVAWATYPERRNDFPEAARRCEVARARFPDELWLYVIGGIALREMGRLDESEILLSSAMTRFPDAAPPFIQWCSLAERRADWAEVAQRCERGRALFPDETLPYTLGIEALKKQHRIAEAQAVLDDGLARFPSHPTLIVEQAQIAMAGERWEDALRSWHDVIAAFSHSPVGPIGAATALQRLVRSEEADAVIEAAMARIPDNEALAEQYGQNAISREDWPLVLERMRRALARFPGSSLFARHLYEAQLRVADAGGEPAPTPDVSGSSEDRDLVLNFESLGGGGHGCEFGTFQRSLGAEPLGLLRWADIWPQHIITALDTDLNGVGEPEFTRVSVPNHPRERPEYWTTDTRYHMAMRSFVMVEDMSLERMTRMLTQRQRFLRRKLLEDLRDGSKIFVYKCLTENLSGSGLARLLAAVRRHGDNTLFYIRYEDADHPNGTVELGGIGLLIGYIDHFSHDPVTDKMLGLPVEQFLTLCRRAYALWRQGLTQTILPA
jgi:predicted Zn-dependent protease